VLYLQPKRNKAARGNEIHTVQEGETMWDISQEYGVKLDRLYEKNGMSPGSQPEPGDKIYLRHKRTDKLFPLKIEEDKSDEDQIQIEFEDN
jgi:LysM repeat protein